MADTLAFRRLVRATRSVRRFHEDRAVERQTLVDLIDLARLSASGGNKQQLKYILSCAASMNARIFPCLGWAAYLKDWPGPREGERPAAYIVILGDTAIRADCDRDLGIAAQSIMLGATAQGLGGCMLDSINCGYTPLAPGLLQTRGRRCDTVGDTKDPGTPWGQDVVDAHSGQQWSKALYRQVPDGGSKTRYKRLCEIIYRGRKGD